MQRVLITGGSGLLALNWACCMRDQFDVVLGTHRHAVNLQGTRSAEIDLDTTSRLTEQLLEIKPDVVIHTAGMTSVEHCEQHPYEAEQANVVLAKHVAAVTNQMSIKLVHISTDHLFAGHRAYVSEDEKPQPMNVYARTKLQAEQQVAELNSDALIVRTNFFGWGHAHRQSFSDWIIASLRAGQSITAFDDVFFTPILADDLATAAHEVMKKGERGIYNIVGDERLSKFEFAGRLAEQLELPKTLISRGQIGISTQSVVRPHDMSLDNSKVRGTLGRDIGSLDEFLKRLNRQEQEGRAEELRNAVTEI